VPDGDNGADIEGRELPNSAYCPTAQGNSGEAPFAVAVVVAVWHLALLGSSRLTAVRALGQFAPLGRSRRFAHPRAQFQRLAPLVHCAVSRTARAVSVFASLLG